MMIKGGTRALLRYGVERRALMFLRDDEIRED